MAVRNLTDEQLEKAMRFVARQMIAATVNIHDVGEVVKWMILNPLPTKEEYEALVLQQDEAEKQLRITALQDELDRLTKEGV